MKEAKRLKNLREARREIVRKEWEKEDGKVEVMLDLMDKIEDLPNELNRKIYVETTVESEDVIAELKDVQKILSDLRIPEPLKSIKVDNLGEIKIPEVKFPGSMTISNLSDIKLPAPINKVVDTNSVVRAIEDANASSITRFNTFASSLYKKEKPVYVKILGRDNRVIDVFGGTAGGGDSIGGWKFDIENIGDQFPLKTVVITSTGGYATFGGGTQYADNTTATGPTGTLNMYWDDTLNKVRAVSDVLPMPVRPQSSTGDPNTSTGITVGTSSATILAAKSDRINYVIVNASTGDIYLRRSSTGLDAQLNAGILIVKRGGSISDNIHKGVVSGIAATTGLIVTVEEI